MLNLNRVVLSAGVGVGVALMPQLALASDPCNGMPGCTSIATMPVPSGIMPNPLEISTSHPDVIITGSMVEAGFLLQVDPTDVLHPTFTELRFITNDPHGIGGDPDLGLLGSQFPSPWVATLLPDGFKLDWQPGAPKLGELLHGSYTYQPYAALMLELDTAQFDNPNYAAFALSTISIQATPEPGAFAFAGGLLAGGGVLLYRSRSRSRSRTARCAPSGQ